MAEPILPGTRVVSVAGNAIVVQVERVPTVPNELLLHITRNGVRETRFTIDELRQVNNEVGKLVVAASTGPAVRGVK